MIDSRAAGPVFVAIRDEEFADEPVLGVFDSFEKAASACIAHMVSDFEKGGTEIQELSWGSVYPDATSIYLEAYGRDEDTGWDDTLQMSIFREEVL